MNLGTDCRDIYRIDTDCIHADCIYADCITKDCINANLNMQIV
jgi:hypothetical protein